MDLSTKWAIALYGWLAYNIVVWFIQKQKADRKNETFDWIKFTKTHYDNWAVTLFFAWPVVSHGPEIHKVFMDFLSFLFPIDFTKIQWYDIYYAGPGPLVEVLYFFATKMWPSIKNKVINRVNGKEDGQEN